MPQPQRTRGDRGRDQGVPVDPRPPSGAEEALRLLLEDSAEDLYEHAPCGYLSTLMDGTIVKVNQTFLTWTGHGRGDLVGRRRFPDLLTVGGRIFYETHLAPMLRLQQGVREIALDLVSADGRPIPVLVNSRVRADPAGAPALVRIMVLDATERTAYERELLVARRTAEQSEARVRGLQQVAADLSAASTVADVARVVATAGTEVFGAARSEVWLLHPETREPGVAAEAGAPRPAEAGDADTAARLLAQGLRDGRPLFSGAGDFPPDQVARAVLPLAVDRAQVGALALELAPPRGVSPAERATLQTFAGQSALALSRARLHEQTALAASRSAFLARLGRELDETAGLRARAERLAEAVVEETADVAVVLTCSETGDWAPLASRARIPGTRALEGAGPEPATLTDPASLTDPATPPAELLEEWSAAATRAVEMDAPQVVAAAGAAVATGTAGVAGPGVVVPLRARGHGLGALVLLRDPEPFWTSDLLFLVDVADRGGLALDNARLREQERDVAHALQRSLLPDRLPSPDAADLVPYYRPAVESLEVGGDWYDAFAVAPGVLAVVVGDVVGRGVGAASAMGQVRSAIRALAPGRLGPAGVLERLDVFVELCEPAQMTTVAYVELELATGRCRYACAGHLPPVVAGREGARLLWGGRSTPLGAQSGTGPRAEAELVLDPGDRLLLYTDGLVERRRRSLTDGLDLLLAEVAAARDVPLPEAVPGWAGTLLGDADHADDVCLLAVQYRGAASLRFAVPAELSALRGARHRLRAWLQANAVAGEDSDAVLLATSEALANAVEHGCAGQPEAQVRVTARRLATHVEVRVADPGTWQHRVGAVEGVAGPLPVGVPDVLRQVERGRGLFLMRALADTVELHRREGTEVVLRRRLRPGTDRVDPATSGTAT